MDEKNFNITATMMMEYIYCKRIPFFSKNLYIPSNATNSYKVREGKRVHKERAQNQSEYLRKKIGVIDKKVDDYLFSSRYNISGKVDEVLFLDNGQAAALDYKYSMFKGKVADSYKLQIVFYSILIEENYDLPVNKGYIVYIRSNNRLEEIELIDEDYSNFFDAYQGLSNIINNNYFPEQTTYSIRFEECSYRKICCI